MPAGIALDEHMARVHFGTDPMDAGQIALPFHAFVARIARDVKELSERQFTIPVKDHEVLDFLEGLISTDIRRDPLDLDRYRTCISKS
jgi:hypothetical protein